MPTIPEIIDIAKISQFLAVVDIANGGLYGGGTDLRLPRKLYEVRKNIERLYNLDPTNSTLTATSNFLYALCGKYKFVAQGRIIPGGSISPISPVTTDVFPFIVKASNNTFTTPTQYDDPRIVGKNISIFINELNQQWLTAPDSFVYTVTGIDILVPGFDAFTNDYIIMFQELNS